MEINHTAHKKKQWEEDEKQLALSMRCKSPALYEQMRSDGFALPSRSTIARWLQEIDIRPGVCPELFQRLKTKVESMSDWERKCLIMFDEMSIKCGLEYDSKGDLVEGVRDLGEDGRDSTPGTNVLVFMARGITHSWKMPIAYFITNKTVTAKYIRKMLQRCVSAVSRVGLDVKAVVCDQGSTNRRAATLLGVSKSEPYFVQSDVGKVFFLYDFPHIVKSIRNNLMKRSKNGVYVGRITTNKGTADWRDVVSLYELDRNSKTARATKLTEKHISPNSFEKMSVKLATQIFSNTVSTALKTAVQMKQVQASAEGTVTFLTEMNNIFDAMNSKAKFNPNPHRCALSASENTHLNQSLKTISEGVEWVKSWTMERSRVKRPPSFDGIEHTMRATLLLWDDLKTDGLSFLLTGRLNQDPLENEFSIARQKCGYGRNPTARMFRQNLRLRLQATLLTPPAGTNCEPDEDQLLDTSNATAAIHSPSTTNEYLNLSVPDEIDTLTESEEDDDDYAGYASQYPDTTPSLEACAVRYFAGYGVRTCLRRFKCKQCEQSMANAASTSIDESLIENRQYNESGGLVLPSDQTTRVAKLVLHVFEKHLLKNLHVVGILKKMILKTNQWINREERDWLQKADQCRNHRDYFVKRILVAKLKRRLQELSKDLRFPGGKNSGYFRKVQNLLNN